jgi:hypothetical protein
MLRDRDAVPDPGRVVDDVRFSELAAQAADRHAHGVGERVGVLIPGLLEQSFGAERTLERRRMRTPLSEGS